MVRCINSCSNIIFFTFALMGILLSNTYAADPSRSAVRATTKAIGDNIRATHRQDVRENIIKLYKTTVNLNMRSKPGGQVITTLKKGAKVEPMKNKQGLWWEISYNGQQGWVHSKYLSQN